MDDATLKFIKRMGIIPEGDIFSDFPKEKKFRIDKPSKRVGQSPLEMTPSSKTSVKPSILSLDTDGFFNGLLCKAVSRSATFAFFINVLPDRFLSENDPVSRNRCTKSVIDAFGAVSPG
ncbi:hypothetical protein TNCV_2870251 [Trichonephila clavipes]|nr:hypothetical protein TNCV_2870251 [Trichonephila clavipes]